MEIVQSKRDKESWGKQPALIKFDMFVVREARGAKEINKYEAKYVLFRMFGNQIAYWCT